MLMMWLFGWLVSTSQKARLFQRSDVVNELIDKNLSAGIKDQRLIAIHVDSRSKSAVTARDLHMLREPKCTSVYVELGNISNKLDQQRFLLASNRQLLAEWLMEGFIK